MHGALLVHKPQGITSFDVIRTLRNKVPRTLKMGHAGTLDPFAEGLLVILLGKAVRLAEYFLTSSKTYRGTWCFGETSASLDPTTEVHQSPCLMPSYETLQRQAQCFQQQPYEQIPPMFSAKKSQGKRLYELARLGREITRRSQTCFLKNFTIESYEPPYVSFEVTCSRGTYLRTLVKDFAESLGATALLRTLLRTRSGSFSLQQAWTVAALTDASSWNELPCFVPFDQLLSNYPQAHATTSQYQALSQGKQEVLQTLLQGPIDSETVGIYRDSKLIAIAEKKQTLWKLKKVFINPPSPHSSCQPSKEKILATF